MADLSDKQVIDWIMSCRDEAEEAKRDRMDKNRDNYAMFHLQHDFTHKQAGQSKEILSKQSMAVEQIRSFFQQALADIGDWWRAEARSPELEATLAIRPEEITKITNYFLEKSGYFAHVGDTIQTGLLGSLAISKVYGCQKPKPRYVSRKEGRGKSMRKYVEKIEDKSWNMEFETIRQENYFPDPSGEWLYEIEDMWIDHHVMIDRSKGDDAIYDSKAVAEVPVGSITESVQEFNKARETGQNTTSSGHRPKVKLTEYWGTILDSSTGEITFENVVATVANDTYLIRKPTPNPLWHQRSPYVKAPLMEVANSVWHRAPMDAPTQHNRALIELYNLFVDAAMMQVHSIKQIRKEALDNPAQVSDGIKAGATLAVNSMLPAGAKVLEPLTAVEIPNAALSIYNIMGQEFNASALTNDLRQGVMPFRAVKATEVVEASQTITSVFQGIAKNFETLMSLPELELAWMTTAQNWDMISKEEFVSLFGDRRGTELSQLSPQDVFVNTVNGIKFRVFGVSLTLSKAQDFRKLTTLLQTVGSSEVLLEEFVKRYDFGKLLGEIMTSLNIDKNKIEIPASLAATMQQGSPMEQGGGQPEAGPDMMSQVPGAGSGSLADIFGGPSFPQTSFPGSPATAGQ